MEKTFCYRSWFAKGGACLYLDHKNESKALAVAHAVHVAMMDGMSHIETKRISRAQYEIAGAFTKVTK